MVSRILMTVVLAGGMATACDGGGERAAAPASAVPEVSLAPSAVRTIANGLRIPWAIAFLPDGSLWVSTSNRDGGAENRPGPNDDRILRVTLPS
jgi:glucose/arabinose dehydrogenase